MKPINILNYKNLLSFIIIPLKSVLIILLFLAFQKMPYKFYEILRISLFFGTLTLIIIDIIFKRLYFIILYFITLILFNPFDKIYFKKDIWHIIDIFIIAFITIALINVVVSIMKIKKYEK